MSSDKVMNTYLKFQIETVIDRMTDIYDHHIIIWLRSSVFNWIPMTKLFEQNCLLDDIIDIIYLLQLWSVSRRWTTSLKDDDNVH